MAALQRVAIQIRTRDPAELQYSGNRSVTPTDSNCRARKGCSLSLSLSPFSIEKLAQSNRPLKANICCLNILK